MHAGQFIFAQLMDFLPRHEFNKCVRRYRGNSRIREFSCFDQFLCMAFAQLTYRESLRDIETCLRAMGVKLYHAGFRGKIARSTLADANEHRDWRIYADFAHVLIAVAKKLYASDAFAVDLDATAYAFDSTTIDLCLSLFPWARFRRRKGAVKLHTLIDLRGDIPCFVRISDGKMHDVRALDDLVLEPGAAPIRPHPAILLGQGLRAQGFGGRIGRRADQQVLDPVCPGMLLHAHMVDRRNGGRQRHLLGQQEPFVVPPVAGPHRAADRSERPLLGADRADDRRVAGAVRAPRSRSPGRRNAPRQSPSCFKSQARFATCSCPSPSPCRR